ncbi:DNase I-like protein [Epithele typhae]|uniref:DNase I-like protein n=1 Tax=Epithele typhae TaxID=378194 RepID=UPI0020079F3D|nr:DNase I-like protein [Epithele typhae]KAH9924271.1 DNase I-like protein [Epithele typhae]
MLGAALAALYQLACAASIADIQGNAFVSPLKGQTVENVTGIVTVKTTSGFWVQGEPSKDIRVSSGLLVYTTSKTILASVTPGDMISVSGTVTEYRSSSNPTYLYATELGSPKNITVLAQNNTVAALVLGGRKGRAPPTQLMSALDAGHDGWLAVPNNQSLVSVADNTLQPKRYGLDFWASLDGQLVTIKSPVANGFQNSYGEFWVHGDWPLTGENSRGGLSITFGPKGIPDANPESVIVGSPADGTKLPKPAMGMQFEDITGVITYQFGFWYIVPLTTPVMTVAPSSVIPQSKIVPKHDKCTFTFGDYNVRPQRSSHMGAVANHIANFLHTPDMMFVQEIQDNSGSSDDGTVIANVTLTNLVAAIASAGNATAPYAFVEIAPENDMDGGQPGGNIRTAYLYDSAKFSLVQGSPAGGALDATAPVLDADGKLSLTYNPGRIDPTNAAWDASRKPLVAVWETPSGARVLTINLHLTSKGGSSSSQGDARPPLNGGVEQRVAQVQVVADFVKSVLALDPRANVVVAGDCNEYAQTRAVFAPLAGLLVELDAAAGVPPAERYTYVYDQNAQQLDHAFVSPALAARGGLRVEHVHVNSWAATESARASDHDPSVGRVRIC